MTILMSGSVDQIEDRLTSNQEGVGASPTRAFYFNFLPLLFRVIFQ